MNPPILAIISAIALIIALVWSIRTAYLASSSASWPIVDGTILHSKLVETSDDTGRWFTARLHYTYTVKAVVYEGTRTHFGMYFRFQPFAWSDQVRGEVGLERYRPGASIRVRVHPNNPSLCTLRAGSSWELYIGIPIIALIIGAILGSLL